MSFKVTVRPSGREFTAEAEETILAAALRSGISLPYGCKNGACGSCKCKGLEGEWVQGPHSSSALSVAEQAARKLLVCSSRPRSDIVIEARELSGFGDIPIRKMACRVARIERAASDVAIVFLQLPANERLQFRAGQHIEFILRDGTRRSYSIATPPHADEQIALHIRHMPGGIFTDALFGIRTPIVKERDILRLEGPLGTFILREDSNRPIVMLASGTGFAPIKAMVEYMFHKRINVAAFGRAARPMVLYWGGRSRQDLYMDALPRRWESEQPNFRYVPVLSEAKPEDNWSGRTGFVHQAVIDDQPDLSGHEVYACGAPVMVKAALNDFIARCRLPEDAFYIDAFTSAADLAQS